MNAPAAPGAEAGFRRRHLLLGWLGVCMIAAWLRRGQIAGYTLLDPDDHLRLVQVRDWLAGQGWFDLTQYRIQPPAGLAMHWSRLVDLPIAGLKLLFAPLIGGANAEKLAVTVAPLLPMGVAMAAVAVAVRRLVAPQAFALAIAVFLCGHSLRGMWAPLRIDHHGWQLACLALALMALTDPKRARGGAILGAATAVSLTIGLEMLLYLAVAGAAAALMWVHEGGQARRLATYGASLAGGCALGYLLFASWANRAPVCDALSPVWLSAMAGAGALCVALTFLRTESWKLRLGAAALGGAVLAGGFALAWPQCLGRLEQVSPELVQLWLGNVREARPIYLHGYKVAVSVSALPVAGLIGYAIMVWRSRRDLAQLIPWGAAAALALLGAGLLLWQSRAGPAAQLLAVPGATALGWLLVPWLRSSRFIPVQVFGVVIAFLLISGILAQQALRLVPQKAQKPGPPNKSGLCQTLYGMKAVAQVPKGLVLTFVDLGPRLITVTHHDAVAGPYHRNGRDIIDIHHAFRGTPERAREIAFKRGVDYVLICPGMPESTLYASQAKDGFYMQLVRGQAPAWLTPVPLPKESPYRMWRVRR